MPVVRKTIYTVVCAIAFGACGVDRGVEPIPTPVQPPEREILTTFRLLPDSVAIEQGGEFQLAIMVRNQRGFPPVFPAISYSTGAPLIASVGSNGFVTGITPGIAVISARTVVGDSVYAAATTITVRPRTVFDSLVLKAESGGWAPTPAHVRAGGSVEWRAGLIATSGRVVENVYLLTPEYGIIDSLDLTGGKATRTFSSPGIIRYCSNACWDPPEFGIIYVH